MEDKEIWTPEQYQRYINGEKSTCNGAGPEKLKADLERKKEQLEDMSKKWVKAKEERDQERLLRIRAEEKIKQLKEELEATEERREREVAEKNESYCFYIIGSFIFMVFFILLALAK